MGGGGRPPPPPGYTLDLPSMYFSPTTWTGRAGSPRPDPWLCVRIAPPIQPKYLSSVYCLLSTEKIEVAKKITRHETKEKEKECPNQKYLKH